MSYQRKQHFQYESELHVKSFRLKLSVSEVEISHSTEQFKELHEDEAVVLVYCEEEVPLAFISSITVILE